MKRVSALFLALLLALSACTASPAVNSPSPSLPVAPKVSVSPQAVEPSQPAAPTDSVSPPQPVETSPAASASQSSVPGLSWVLPDPDPSQEPSAPHTGAHSRGTGDCDGLCHKTGKKYPLLRLPVPRQELYPH